MAVVETSLPALLGTLTQSLTSALEFAPEPSTVIPPNEGISLLDVKNDLLLSYLQNLVFLILLKLRNSNGNSTDSNAQSIDDAVVGKLVEMRVYLEKGVRPLEGRLKYQIDKVLRAADNASRASAVSANGKGGLDKGAAGDDDELSGDSEEEEAGSTEEVALQESNIDDLQYRPNPLALTRPIQPRSETEDRAAQDGLYRPPRITATAMPVTTGPREREARKPNKSATLDEFVSTELSTAPTAEPSIGSTIVSGGRRSKSEKERKDEAERREYEEMNYVRLPKETKKEKAKKGRRQDAGYGGEEWRGLGEGLDRIERLTKSKGDHGTVLDKSRKRLTEDGPRSSGGGVEVGQGFQKRLKTLDGGRRDRGRR
ncbi:MAG: hypothetical protein M1818_007093 [Claussenomyces sp. TS43310]|nr:MAG: hypothetical protein M1818_007093 [Claussenomyces sp. TS43310]